ncbi:two-component sensor histidine kinase [Sphaerisporangium melleum]|uniref:Oxygen sensor histidine kinase NreB n=1 Tax=Sphaerisporangium melleum TaxID=321316 RepID=A0A917RL79_9ACTN|nr:histidine kinase [Sphaerisporangium melleum]GGL11967.1 two-component sensor histidine kinase [Sphaerisporangium melleum]GII74367.1 two-component sensor histidine kinase [Sphaerisporangium melleum]
MVKANQILTDMGRAVRSGLPPTEESLAAIARGLATTEETEGVHPRESLLAASVFFRTAFTTLSRRMQGDSESAHLLRRLVTILEESISLRIREAANGYAGFLLSKVHEAHLAERRRIARELHDRIGQCLSVAHRQAELASMLRNDAPATAAVKIERAQEAIQEAMRRLRQLTSGLHPHESMQGLEKALLAHLELIGADDAGVELLVNGDESWLSPAVGEECLLILGEATRNALSHADASAILIRVDIAPHALHASVVDDGRGFDSRLPPARNGLGLVSIEERVTLMGGTVSITSEVGRGTRIEFTVPLRGSLDQEN